MYPCTPEALALRWVPGEGPVDIRPLASGFVNESYRVSRGGRAYSLRVAAAHGADLGLDRAWECRVRKAAAHAQLAPAVLECDPVSGIVVASWIDGRTWTRDEALQPDALGAMARLLRQVHALPIPVPARALSAADWIAHYSGALATRGVLPPKAAALSATASQQLAELGLLGPVKPVICHSDLHCQNLLLLTPATDEGPKIGERRAAAGRASAGGLSVGDGLVLLDWEYAHVSDPFWDVVGWACNNDWSTEHTEALLSAYLQRAPTDGEGCRLRALAWLYDYVCLLWSELYVNLRDGPDTLAVSQRTEELSHRLRQLR